MSTTVDGFSVSIGFPADHSGELWKSQELAILNEFIVCLPRESYVRAILSRLEPAIESAVRCDYVEVEFDHKTHIAELVDERRRLATENQKTAERISARLAELETAEKRVRSELDDLQCTRNQIEILKRESSAQARNLLRLAQNLNAEIA